MADIRPFRGWFYNTEKVDSLGSVVAPPYDVISAAETDELYARSPFNIVKLILGHTSESDTDTENRYTRAARLLKEWRDKQVLVRQDSPAIYVYQFKYWMSGVQHVMRGMIALVALREFAAGEILPHEHTFPGPKADRLKLMSACHANLDQIYATFNDPSKVIQGILASAMRATFEDVDDAGGTRHQLATITDNESIATIQNVLRNRTLYIADGHHRYETSLNYAKEQRLALGNDSGELPSDFMPILLVDTANEDVSVLPTHRVIRMEREWDAHAFLSKLRDRFRVNEEASLKTTVASMREQSEHHCLGLYFGGRFYSAYLVDEACLDEELPPEASSDWKRLDVAILQTLVIEGLLGIKNDDRGKSERVTYTEDELDAVQEVDCGSATLCILLNPTKMSQIEAVAEHGEKMPQKSTYFYPKPLTGMIINTHD